MRAIIITISFLAFSYGTPAIKSTHREHSSNRIIGGADTDIEKAPFMVVVEESLNGGRFSLCCGAALISPTFAVTSAFLIGQPEYENRLRVGTSKWADGGLVVPIKRVIQHPKFETVPDMDYDVALIELEYPLILNAKVQTIKISDNETRPGDLVTYFGWGENDPTGSDIGESDTLQSAEVPIWDNGKCNDTYNDHRFWKSGPITERVLCAGDAGTEGCFKDLGAPLVIDNELIGVMSWGDGCAKMDVPPVFTNLLNDEIREFIRENAGL